MIDALALTKTMARIRRLRAKLEELELELELELEDREATGELVEHARAGLERELLGDELDA